MVPIATLDGKSKPTFHLLVRSFAVAMLVIKGQVPTESSEGFLSLVKMIVVPLRNEVILYNRISLCNTEIRLLGLELYNR